MLNVHPGIFDFWIGARLVTGQKRLFLRFPYLLFWKYRSMLRWAVFCMKNMRRVKRRQRTTSKTRVPTRGILSNFPKHPHSSMGKSRMKAWTTTASNASAKPHSPLTTMGIHSPRIIKTPKMNSIQGRTLATTSSRLGIPNS